MHYVSSIIDSLGQLVVICQANPQGVRAVVVMALVWVAGVIAWRRR